MLNASESFRKLCTCLMLDRKWIHIVMMDCKKKKKKKKKSSQARYRKCIYRILPQKWMSSNSMKFRKIKKVRLCVNPLQHPSLFLAQEGLFFWNRIRLECTELPQQCVFLTIWCDTNPQIVYPLLSCCKELCWSTFPLWPHFSALVSGDLDLEREIVLLLCTFQFNFVIFFPPCVFFVCIYRCVSEK